MDTGQETNGLVFADGTPKLPVAQIFQIVTGGKDTEPGRRRPRRSACRSDETRPADPSLAATRGRVSLHK